MKKNDCQLTGDSNQTDVIRVLVDQPAMPHYRVPVFRELASRQGIDLTVWYGKEDGLENVAAVGFKGEFKPAKYIRLGGRPILHWTPHLTRVAKSKKFDCIVMSWKTRNLSLPIALMNAKWSNTATVLWGHGYSKDETNWRRKLRNGVAILGDALLLYSKQVSDQMRQRNIREEKLFTAQNCMDLSNAIQLKEKWIKQPEKLQEFQRKHKIYPGQPCILFVSRVTPDNGVDQLLHSAARLRNRHPDLVVFIIGKISASIDEQLKTLIQDLGIEKNVRWIGPVYDENELAPWFLSSTLFCYPKNIGLSLHHAMAYGLPIVTSDDPAVQNPEFEVIRHQVNALTYRESKTHSMDHAIERLISDKSLREEIGTEAARLARETLTIENMVDGMVDAIQFAVAQHNV